MSVKKIEKSPFDPFVKKYFPKLLPLVPKWMTANQITVLGLILCVISAVCLGLSELNPVFYLIAAFLFLLTWVTDTLDGVVARARGEESVLGHYLDHYGDSWNIIFIGVALFLTNGSHVLIGLICCVIFLMFHVDGHIKVSMTGTLELPAFGPTEIRFVIAAAMIAAAFIDPGQPLSWFPEITGNEGWLTKALGFETGLTFLDTAGLLVASGSTIGLIGETFFMVRRFAREDAKKKSETLKKDK